MDLFQPSTTNNFGLQLRVYDEEEDEEEEEDDWSVADAAMDSEEVIERHATDKLPVAMQLRLIAEKERLEKLEDENLDLREVCQHRNAPGLPTICMRPIICNCKTVLNTPYPLYSRHRPAYAYICLEL